MSKYIQLRNQIQKLEKEAESLRKRELSEVLANIKDAIAVYGLTAKDLGLAVATLDRRSEKLDENATSTGMTSDVKRRSQTAKRATAKDQSGLKAGKLAALRPSVIDKRSVVAPKYCDSATGATWTGRGKQPKWLAAAIKGGKKLEDFKI